MMILKTIAYRFSVRLAYNHRPDEKLNIFKLRTILYNYLYSYQNKGKFILKVQDLKEYFKKQSALVEKSMNQQSQLLHWLNISFNQGPHISDSPFPPYRQSQRLPIYKQYEKKLVQKAAVYPCFCTLDRLRKLREQQKQKNLPIKYDETCRFLSLQKITMKIRNNERYALRFKNKKELIQYEDEIFGRIQEENDVEDFLITHTSGIPSAEFCNIVDDIELKVTHIIRDSQYIKDTPKHIFIYKALQVEIPKFAHLPKILYKEDNQQLTIQNLRKKNYQSEALINTAALLGWFPYGDNLQSKLEKHEFTMDELIQYFYLAKINKQPVRFNKEQLNQFNTYYIKQKYEIKKHQKQEQLNKKLENFKHHLQCHFEVHQNEEEIKKINKIAMASIKNWDEIKKIGFLFQEPDYTTQISRECFKRLYDQQLQLSPLNKIIFKINEKYIKNKLIINNLELILIHIIEPENFNQTQLAKRISKFLLDHHDNISNQNVYKLLRYCITGRTSQSNILQACIILGKEKVLQRLRKFI